MLAEQSRPQIPMDKVVANELEILGSHGIQAHRYGAILDLILAGKLRPGQADPQAGESGRVHGRAGHHGPVQGCGHFGDRSI